MPNLIDRGRFRLGASRLRVDNQREVHLSVDCFLAIGSMTNRPAHRSTIALRHCRWLLIAAWAVVFASPIAFAQSVGPAPDVSSPVPPSPVVVGAPEQSSNSLPFIARGPCDPDYWIVSTRHCKEEVECGQACNYHVIRFDGSNFGLNSSLDELIGSLRPGVPVCFMAHGSFVTFESMLRDSSQTYRWLREAAPGQPVHMVFYSWASEEDGLLPQVYVNRLGRRAAINGFYLADLISRISVDHPICLIGHSHGTRMVSAALHAMAGGIIEGKVLTTGPREPRRIRAVMAAAAIDHDWLNPNERYGQALCQAEAIINLRNHADLPLQFYPLRRPISSRALAVTGLTRTDRMQLGDWNQKIIDCDVTDLIRFGHIWCHYYSRPEIATAIRHYVYFDDPQPIHYYSSAKTTR